MKQYLLAAALIAAPVVLFAGGYSMWSMTHVAPAVAGLGDLTSFVTLVADVQKIAATGDLAGAATKVREYESAWDQAETALRPKAPELWNAIDKANDAAFSALRASNTSADEVGKTLQGVLDALQAAGGN